MDAKLRRNVEGPGWTRSALRRTFGLANLAVLGWWLAAAGGLVLPAQAQEAAGGADAEVPHLVAALDSPDYFTRENAMRQLRALVAEKPHAAQVAAQLHRLSFDEQVSYETQLRLAEILADVPKANLGEPNQLTDTEVHALVAGLVSDRFAQRQSALRRGEWLLTNDQNIVPILLAIKAKLSDSALAPSLRQLLEQQYELARGAWIMAPADRCPLPPVAQAEIDRLLAVVSTPPADEGSVATSRVAVSQLEELLAQEPYRQRLSQQLVAALDRAEDITVRNLLTDLVDLTKPAMVAEIWSSLQYVNLGGGMLINDTNAESMRLGTSQYLHVGVPQIPEGAERATYFDRCDDKVAHCVSGNTLTPGDYPVGTAFAHPHGQNILFYLVNLPTPRRRLQYEHLAKRDQAIRFREISQRTCDAFLSGERKLNESDITVLMLLDRAVVNQFADDYLRQAKDEALESRLPQPVDIGLSPPRGPVDPTSQFGAICYVLARRGDDKSAARIAATLEADRFLPRKSPAAHDLPRIALLAIAQREKWPEGDAWLVKQLSQNEQLVGAEPAPQLGATAAAILAARLGVSPDTLPLVEARDELCLSLGLMTYKFASDEAGQEAAAQLTQLHKARQPAVPKHAE